MEKWQHIPNLQENVQDKGNVSYTNTSLVRVINILLCLSNGLNTLTDIANYCNYSTSTVHRLLNVMKRTNLAVQDTFNHKFYLGPLLSQLISNQTAAHRYLIINALQEMGRISDLTEETINLTILDQFHYILLHDIPCKHDLKIIESNRIYGVLFAAGATGKVLLSQLEDKEIREFLNKIDLPEVTEKSVIDKNTLLAQLNTIRHQGYAVSCGEKIPGAMCISATISGYEFPAAISILGPEIRLKSREADLVQELKQSANRIIEKIGRSFIKGGDK
jgi:IclR family transcriptional regulator, KDG regulon repressor